MKSANKIMDYFKELADILLKIQASDASAQAIGLDNAIEEFIKEISAKKNKQGKVIIIGNGGSAAIANHTAIDLWKNCGVKAISFSDSALLTCVSNDFGYEHVFAKPIEMFARRGDTLIAISSSGESQNILHAVGVAKKKHCQVITLSGFKPRNKLRLSGELNFYVPSISYGYVEIVHSLLCHFIVDRINTNG